jgi:hypothetical protein
MDSFTQGQLFLKEIDLPPEFIAVSCLHYRKPKLFCAFSGVLIMVCALMLISQAQDVVRLDFDEGFSAPYMDAQTYFRQRGIVTAISPDAVAGLVHYDSAQIGSNFLSVIPAFPFPVTGTVSVEITLNLPRPADQVRFTRPAVLTGGARPQYGIITYDRADEPVSRVSELLNCTNCPMDFIPAAQMTLHGPGIRKITIYTELPPKNYAIGFRLDDLEISYATNSPPAVVLRNPAQNSTLSTQDVGLLAEAVDEDGTIARIDFYAGTNLIAQSFGGVSTAAWTNPPPGAYLLTAVAIDNLGASTVSAPVSVIVDRRRISGQPKSQVLVESAALRLEVLASGDSPTYQWFHNGTPILGATSNVFAIAAVTVDANGEYFVDISRGSEVVRSDVAHVGVVPKLAPEWKVSQRPRLDVWAPNGPVTAIAVKDNIAYIGGQFTSVGPANEFGAVLDRITAAPLAAFPKFDGPVYAAVQDESGGLYVAGAFTHVADAPRSCLAHLFSDGTIDPRWAPTVGGGFVRALALVGGTNVFVGGNFQTINGASRTGIAAVAADTGAVRLQEWNQFNTAILAMVGGDDFLYAAGTELIAVNLRTGEGSLLPIGSVLADVDFGGTIFSLRGTINALEFHQGLLYLGGQFNRIGNQRRDNFAVVEASTSILQRSPSVDGIVETVEYNCGKVFIGGHFEQIGSEKRHRIGAVDIRASEVLPWNPLLLGASVLNIHAIDDIVYLSGEFNSVNGQERANIAAVDRETGANRPWAARSGIGTRLVSRIGGAIFAGGPQLTGGVERNSVAAIDLITGRPTDWNPNVRGSVTALAVTETGVLIGGTFTEVNERSRRNLAETDKVLGAVTDWNPSPDRPVNSLAQNANTIFVGGDFSTINGLPRSYIAAFNKRDHLLATFNPAIAADPCMIGAPIVRSLIATNGVLYAAGSFATDTRGSCLAAWNASTFDRLPLELRTGDPCGGGTIYSLAYAYGHLYFSSQLFHEPYTVAPFTGVTNLNLWAPLAAVDPQNSQILTWSLQYETHWTSVPPEFARSIHPLAAAPNAIYVGDNHLPGFDLNDIRAISPVPPGSVDDWQPDPNDYVTSLAVAGPMVVVGGPFTHMGSYYRPNLAVFAPISAPIIDTQPAGGVAEPGTSFTLAVGAQSAEPSSYQWYFQNAPLPRATEPQLRLESITVAQSGEYFAVVSNRFGTAASHSARLIVRVPSQIVSQPEDQILAPAGEIHLHVGAAGNPQPEYQWRLNGVVIPGAAFPDFVITNADATNSGIYTVVVDNGFAAIISRPTTIKVISPSLPFSDEEVASAPIGGSVGQGSGSNINATRAFGEPNHAGKRGGHSVWLHWRPPVTGIAVMRTRGSDFDTLLAVYSKDSNGKLLQVAADDDSGGFLTSLVTFNASTNVDYLIAVDGYFGARGNIVFTWNLESTDDELPHIGLDPQSQTVTAGEHVVLSVISASTTPQTFQWYRNCEPIRGATNSIYDIGNVSIADVGIYSVTVANSNRVAFSRAADLQIYRSSINTHGQARAKLGDLLPTPVATAPARLAAAGLADSPIVSVSVGVVGLQQFDTFDGVLPSPITNVIGGHSKWFGIHPQADGLLKLDTGGTPFDTLMSVFTWDGNEDSELNLIAFDDNGGESLTSRLRIPVRGGVTYYVNVDGYKGVQGDVSLSYRLDPPDFLPLRTLLRHDQFFVDFNGAGTNWYEMQRSFDLIHWTPMLQTNVVNGLFEYRDLSAQQERTVFYRVTGR